MGSLGSSELIIVLIVVLVLFGGAKLPQLARSIGEAKRELDDGMKDEPKPTPGAARPEQAERT